MSDANEQLLRRVALGELSPSDDAIVRACADAEFERELEALLEVRMEVEHVGVLEEARREAEGATEDRIEQWVQSQAVRDASVASPPLRWIFAAAAVILLGLGLWSFWPRGDTPVNGDTILGDTDIRCLAPLGQVDDYPPFRWEGGPAGASYEVEVLDENGALVEGGASSKLRTTTWTPRLEDVATWPDKINWTVTCFEREGMVFAQDSQEASR